MTEWTDAKIRRFSSRTGRLDHALLSERLKGAKSYRRIAGYFRSSIFELVGEDLEGVDDIRIVCNGDLDPRDVQTAKALEVGLKEQLSDGVDTLERLMKRERYRRLYNLLKSKKVAVRVVAGDDAPFLHGKAGVIEAHDGSKIAFIGSLNETREGWSRHYEIVWEDASPEGVAWVHSEFEWLWARGRPLPEAVIEEIGRTALRREVEIGALDPEEVAPAALVEAPIFSRDDGLQPWQRSFVSMFLQHRETYGENGARLLLADEVGVGKTLSLATSALVSALLGDGPVLILCPSTLTRQWQVELKDKLGIPSAVWLSNRKAWLDPSDNVIKANGPKDVVRCPYWIGIVSTGLVFQQGVHVHDRECAELLKMKFGMVILDEAHKARRTRGLNDPDGEPNNLLSFMMAIARRARHVLLGTGTPIQTHVAELWDLMGVLNSGASHVLGGPTVTDWARPEVARDLITGARQITDEAGGWALIRNPLPPGREDTLFDHCRSELSVSPREFRADRSHVDLSEDVRADLRDALASKASGLAFFQRHNPIVRHVVLRKRRTLEEMGLLKRIAVDVFPSAQCSQPGFAGRALVTSSAFDEAYECATAFGAALRKRDRSAGITEKLMQQRICSSFASGLSTAKALLAKRQIEAESDADDLLREDAPPTIERDEASFLKRIIELLEPMKSDPKLEVAKRFLLEHGWLDRGCIVFSQYFDTSDWVARGLSSELPAEPVAVYAGLGKSGIWLAGDFASAERETIKEQVKQRRLRLVVATDAACEGLNLQTLGTLINMDLPWNPSRLEQRLGWIKRFGQLRERVSMLNLVYQGTRDEDIYNALSGRMENVYDIFGSLPDTIEDEWIEDVHTLAENLRDYTNRKAAAQNAFDVLYGGDVYLTGKAWETCETVLARRDIYQAMSKGW
ncbi:phospholipase D-like domain-containing anti-phage protein [Hyphomicrobium facile]|uniref:Helicase conserved C-terminal domain-containing protein n=1 Tax=Hyphomicrobium facile TaxID=51670 RepID=A0A1I7NVK5_9HYPH|nr:phospholipase D-like domain-containing anti-phage protein [Hyphomicrobium facile]SFV38699.1 Helicase conserved C-terminal domain-containing protein [Hyphomicrobium facile]